ncbi:MAG TPA: glycosyltransferase family 39 protein, partial [Anaerolineae bacterium]|nr:glycosyltransferase family 39 protein [Anaerolineae bacterium]
KNLGQIWVDNLFETASWIAKSDGDHANLWLAALVLMTSPFYFLAALRYQFPVGFGGLYALMAQEMVENQFRLPLHVPFYGPGGIPFAYPPLGPYLMAVVTGLTGVQPFDYMRFAPPLFSLLALIVAYLLFHRITNAAAASFVATAGVSLSPIVFDYNVTAGGIVRGFAQMAAIGSLYALFRWLQDAPRSFPVWPGVLFGMTILSHLTNALFVALAVPLVCAFHLQPRSAVVASAKVVLVGMLLSAPWWIHVLASFGPAVYLNAMRSHGALDVLARLSDPLDVERTINSMRYMYGVTPVLFYLVAMGAGVVLVRGRPFLAVWFWLCLFSLNETERLTIFVGALLAAEFLVAVLPSLKKGGKAKATAALGVAILAAYNSAYSVRNIVEKAPGISEDTQEISMWFDQNTPSEATFIALGAEDQVEWMPYLLRRTPRIGGWGSEWLGTYYSAAAIGWEADSCYNRQSWRCVTELLTRRAIEPNYLIVLQQPGRSSLADEIALHNPVLFRNSEATVFLYRYPQ